MAKDTPNTNNATDDEEEPTDFETAIAACSFGKYNLLLLLICVPGIASTVFETSTMSYILPTAECDLNLSLMYKGILNAITYAGMILSAIPWGYIADTMGRKKVLVGGLLLDGVFVLCASLSQSVTQLLVFKFFGGFFVCGPFAVFMSYISEFHGRKHRSRVMMTIGLMKTTATLLLPLLAYIILPYHMFFHIGYFRVHTWQVFVAVCAAPSLLSGSLLVLFPESPKFLMSQGRNEEALKAFQTIYRWNTGQDRDTYPVKTLFEEAPEKTAKQAARASLEKKTMKDRRKQAQQSFIDGIVQLKPMFSSSYLKLSILVYLMHFCILMGQNTIRLWLPQLFASTAELEHKNLGASSMCAVLAYNVNKTSLLRMQKTTTNCDIHITADSYTNNIIVAAFGFVGYLLASLLVNKLGNKYILCIGAALSCVSGSALYFSTTSLSTLVISSIFVTVCGISATTVISASVNIFPTGVRTMVIILVMTFGRFGSLLGNILFPFLISLGCIPPFVMVGSVTFGSFIISTFLPNTDKLALK